MHHEPGSQLRGVDLIAALKASAGVRSDGDAALMGWAAEEIKRLRILVRKVHDMAGIPDLFEPSGGWEEWMEQAEEALHG